GRPDVTRRAEALRALAEDAQRAARRGSRIARVRHAPRRGKGPLLSANARALEGNGVGLDREIALAGRIQRGLETLHRLDRAAARRRSWGWRCRPRSTSTAYSRGRCAISTSERADASASVPTTTSPSSRSRAPSKASAIAWPPAARAGSPRAWNARTSCGHA